MAPGVAAREVIWSSMSSLPDVTPARRTLSLAGFLGTGRTGGGDAPVSGGGGGGGGGAAANTQLENSDVSPVVRSVAVAVIAWPACVAPTVAANAVAPAPAVTVVAPRNASPWPVPDELHPALENSSTRSDAPGVESIVPLTSVEEPSVNAAPRTGKFWRRFGCVASSPSPGSLAVPVADRADLGGSRHLGSAFRTGPDPPSAAGHPWNASVLPAPGSVPPTVSGPSTSVASTP